MTNAWGMDVSVWQDLNSTPQMVDFAKAKNAGMDFVYIKASQSLSIDPDYLMNWRNAQPYLYRGAYHFLVWNVAGYRQADFYWSLMQSDPGELPLMVDFEWWQTTPPNALVVLRSFCDRLKQHTTRPIGLYTAAAFWRQFGSRDPYWKQFHLWICDIVGAVEVPAPWTRWTFHQYTFKLHGPTFGAESKDLDGDWYNGTVDDMRREFGLEVEQPPEQRYQTFMPGVMGG